MNDRDRILNRRQMLTRCGMGMGAVALTSLLGSTGQLAAAPVGEQPQDFSIGRMWMSVTSAVLGRSRADSTIEATSAG